MNNSSKIRVFQLFLLVCMVFFMASVAQAGPSHHHHGNADVVSPFDKKDTGKPLHCLLNLHLQNGKAPCPHENRDGKNNSYELRPDCGTHSGPANSANNSIAKDLSKITSHNSVSPTLFSWQIEFLPDENLQKLPRYIEHPPQLT
jgi:hypothetical protein